MKGTIKGPGVNVWHAGFYKNFAFGEQIRLRSELTATNVFNRQNFSNPQMNITQAADMGVRLEWQGNAPIGRGKIPHWPEDPDFGNAGSLKR